LVGVLDEWPNKRGQRVKKKINSTMVDEPVAKHGSVLAASVVHAEVVQWGHHPGMNYVAEEKKGETE